MREELHLYGHGKLLLTGEYFVLDGARALAIPTRLGQRFTVTPMAVDSIYDLVWIMHSSDRQEPKKLGFRREDWSHSRLGQDPVRSRLQQLFYAAEQLRPRCTVELLGRTVETFLEFPADWGLGSSSTLVYALARLLKVNAYDLLELSFDGSGYDLACAGAAGPIAYRRQGSEPEVTALSWHPEWLDRTCFVHLNRKQNSREGIAAYRRASPVPATRDRISAITLSLVREAHDLRSAARLLDEHEVLVGHALGMTPVGKDRFTDFPGTVKSLGAWGGDFVWVLPEGEFERTRAYFNERGYPTVIAYNEMAL